MKIESAKAGEVSLSVALWNCGAKELWHYIRIIFIMI
jgi:hypothetical protein